jgi:hypothetical protein
VYDEKAMALFAQLAHINPAARCATALFESSTNVSFSLSLLFCFPSPSLHPHRPLASFFYFIMLAPPLLSCLVFGPLSLLAF